MIYLPEPERPKSNGFIIFVLIVLAVTIFLIFGSCKPSKTIYYRLCMVNDTLKIVDVDSVYRKHKGNIKKYDW